MKLHRIVWALGLVLGACDSDSDGTDTTTSTTDATSVEETNDTGANDTSATETSEGDTAADIEVVDHAPIVCNDVSVHLGNPLAAGSCAPTDGQLTVGSDVCAVRATTLVADGAARFTSDGTQVWRVDGTTLDHVVGEATGAEYDPVDCASTSFTSIRGIAVVGTGHLVIAEHHGNALVHVANPGEGCVLEVIAGNRTATLLSATSPRPLAGDFDGALSDARFDGPMWPSAVSGGVAFWDDGNHKLKVLGQSDITTKWTAPAEWDVGAGGVGVTAMFAEGTTAWLALSNYPQEVAGSVAIIEVDLEAGTHTTLASGVNADWSGGQAAARIDSLARGIEGLYAIDHGVVSFVTLAGPERGSIHRVAGVPDAGLDFPIGYDPLAVHAADEAVLLTSPGNTGRFGANQFVSMLPTRSGQDQVYVSSFPGSSAFTVTFECVYR